MVFSSTIFLFLFFPAVLLIYYNPWFRARRFRNGVLLGASLLFYAWGEPVFVFVLVLSIIITWRLGFALITSNKTHKKVILYLGISFHVILLFCFKYLSFLSGQIALLFHQDTTGIQIALPIGISFFTFQLMSYLFDIYYGRVSPQENLLDLGLYISFFPQLIAGPIVRYNQIVQELAIREERIDEAAEGMRRFVYGLAKKVLIANYLAQIADNTFDYMSQMSVMTAWLGSICYTLQIYYDFSGYSDMAIGIGRMFGFHFSENFNYPYISQSVTEFWRRWHISLSTWFRDYVYIPLGGNRVSKPRWIRNLFIVWLLTGIWHGANWTFLCWGLIYFFMLLFEKKAGLSKQHKTGWKRIVSVLYTMLVVNFAWVFFRSGSIREALSFIGVMFGAGAKGFADPSFIDTIRAGAMILSVSIVGAAPVFPAIAARLKRGGHMWIEAVWMTVIFLLSVLQVVSSTYNPFIYFNF